MAMLCDRFAGEVLASLRFLVLVYTRPPPLPQAASSGQYMARDQLIVSCGLPDDSRRVHLEALLSLQDAKLAKLERQIICLQKQRDDVQNIVDRYRAVLSSARQLPFEVLQEIFIHCLPGERNAAMSIREAPLLLGQVCRAWRSVSQCTPRLWASIHIPIPCALIGDAIPESRKAASARNELVKAWLERSGSCPLSISLAEIFANETSPDFHVLSNAGADVMATLAQFSRRWRRVEFSCSSSAFQTLMAVSREDVPMLESLSIECIQDRQKEFSKSAFLAPRLRTVRLSHMPGDISDYRLDWSNITELFVDDHGSSTEREPYVHHKITLPKAWELLSRCQNLVRCTLHINDRDESALTENALDPIYLPCLTELDVTEGLCFLSPLFDCIHAPGLRTFRFATSLKRLDHMFSPSKFLSRLSALKALTLDLTTLSRTHIIECLRWTPTIASLTLMTPNRGNRQYVFQDERWKLLPAVCDDSLLELFVRREETADTCLCPRLQSFQCNWNSFTDVTLLRFVKSRTGSAGGLERVAVSFDRAQTVDLKSPLTAAIAEGLELSVDYPPIVSVSAWEGLRWDCLNRI
ncbi:hypothetical protein LshimejAT787_0806480 [Lyophyllum shimeji]|uniref:F-box domain-containing protein n=1 Tax=Lyophyllum shimeji TaxID=47721 RepID=A0A9P3PQG3_LYOSH|nr:hypothetical protein LshimejAT787_0806480 [Lyophyllum shimeji]